MNRTGTSIGKYLLAMHPFAIGIGIILSILFVSKRNLTPVDFIPLFLGIFFFIFIVVYYYLPGGYPNKTYPLKNVNKMKNVKVKIPVMWPYPHNWYLYSYVLSLIIVFIWVKPTTFKILFFSIFTLTYIIYPKTDGSVWCWSDSFISPVIVNIGWIIIRKLPNSQILV
jgi:hypothetical protein